MLDLQNAKLLKLFLRIGYYDYEIKGEKDICTLTRMCLKSSIGLVSWVLTGIVLTMSGLLLLSPLVWVTMMFPEGYQPSVYIIEFGMVGVVTWLILSCLAIFSGILAVKDGVIPLAPEYMKRPLRKLFKKNATKENNTKDKEPSETWIAVKEMYKAFKEKTCIKIKL